MSQKVRRKEIFYTTTHLAVVILLLIVFISVGYFFFLTEPTASANKEKQLAELQQSHSVWGNRKPLSFRYVVHRQCFCQDEYIEPYIATEERGYRTAEFPIQIESRSGEMLDIPPEPIWIDDLFTLARQSIADDVHVDISFDPHYGYPILLHVQPNYVDSDTRYEIRDFEVLEYDDESR